VDCPIAKQEVSDCTACIYSKEGVCDYPYQRGLKLEEIKKLSKIASASRRKRKMEKELLSMEIKGYTSSQKECTLEITDAGLAGYVWLNIEYKNRSEQQSYIVVKLADLLEALGKESK